MAGLASDRCCNFKGIPPKSGSKSTHRRRETRVSRQGALAAHAAFGDSAVGIPSEPLKREGDSESPKRTHAAKVELPFEHRILARVLEHDEIGVEITSLVLIVLVPAARLAGRVAVGAAEAVARAHTLKRVLHCLCVCGARCAWAQHGVWH